MDVNHMFQLAAEGKLETLVSLFESNPIYVTYSNRNGSHLIHVAVQNRNEVLIRMIVKTLFGEREVDAQDSHGKTPLHLAVAAGDPVMTKLLLDLNAATDIKDEQDMMAIHLAAELKDDSVLKVLLGRGINPNVKGDAGYTPLHIAAAGDNHRALTLLIKNGGDLFVRSSTGSYPIHVAAKCGSARALKTILDEGLKQGHPLDLILGMKDREKQLPIHSAVTSGNIQAVEMCLNYGALFTNQQDDGSTPVHYAATQGNVDILKCMFNHDHKQLLLALTFRDVQGRTPLHWAVFFNHVEVVKYLIFLQADLNCIDNSKQTPLLSAASCGAWETLNILLDNGADVTATDVHYRNFLHQAVRSGYDLHTFFDDLRPMDNIKARTNERDIYGNTPLHYASKEGYVYAVDKLLKLGASPIIKDKNRQSAFHIAASQGRYGTCKILLNSSGGSVMKNETDASGMTALHLSAQNGHLKILTMLIQHGALVTRDNKENTPLHVAAENGYSACVHILMTVHSYLLDSVNIDGNTALHLAASNGHAVVVKMLLTAGATILINVTDCSFFDNVIFKGHQSVADIVISHERWEECLQHKSKLYGLPILGLIQHLPSVYLHVLDRCVIHSDIDPSNDNYYVSYNFRYLYLDRDFKAFAREMKLEYSNLLPLEFMIKFDRVECLSHPLTLMFLRMKWKNYGLIVNIFDLTVYIIYLTALTWFIVSNRSLNHFDPIVMGVRPLWDLSNFDDFLLPSNTTPKPNKNMIPLKSSWEFGSPWFPTDAKIYKCDTWDRAKLWTVILFCLFQLLKEFLQFYKSKIGYLKDIRNYLECSTYISSLFFSIPFLFGYSTHVQWDAGAVSIFLAWFNCLVNLQRFDFIGIYIIMFLAIMKTLVQVFLIFVMLVTAFGLAFYVLMQEEPSLAHSTPFLSIYRTFILIFEIEYLLTLNTVYLDNDPSTLHYSSLTFILLAVFLFCMPLLLVNLLIGLAVGDIASVQRDAKQKKLATQVMFHASIEEKLPFLSKVPKDYKIYPNHLNYVCSENIDLFKRFTSNTIGNEEKTKVEETFLGKEIIKVKKRVNDLFTVCDRNREMMQEIMKHMGLVTEDDHNDEDITDHRFSDAILEDTSMSKKVHLPYPRKYSIWKSV